MSKNQKISMTKEDGTAVKNIFIGARWDMNKYAGESDVDFDIHGFLTNADRKVQYPKDIVNYNTYEDGSTYPWIEFSGDNRTGDDAQGIEFNGEHFDEYFIIHADKFPADRTDFTILSYYF